MARFGVHTERIASEMTISDAFIKILSLCQWTVVTFWVLNVLSSFEVITKVISQVSPKEQLTTEESQPKSPNQILTYFS